ISGEHQAVWRAGVHDGLLTRNYRLNLIVFLVERLDEVPAQSIIEGKIRANAPTVLTKETCVFIPEIKAPSGRLDVVAWNPKQEVREIGTCFRSAYCESAIEGRVRVHVDLVIMGLTAEPECMCTANVGNVVAPMVGRIVLVDSRDRHSHDETVENDVLD